MLIPKNDKIRHRILEVLNAKTNNQEYRHNFSISDWFMPVNELCTLAKISQDEYSRVISIMFDRKEIGLDKHKEKDVIHILQPGITALNEKSYIKEGKEKTKRNISFALSFSGVISLVFSAIATIHSCNSSADNRRDIKLLQQQIDAIKGK